MDRRAKAIIAVMGVALVALGIAFGVAMWGGGGHMGGGNSYMSMMQGMGSMDADEMMQSMRQTLGEERYAQMLGHM